jgi:hypothetical protein
MGDWPPNNMGVKMQNAVRDMVDACNDSGSISLDNDGSPKQFICPNTYYDNGDECWKSINPDGDDTGNADQCIANTPELDCDPAALNVGSMLKSPECSRAFAKASIMHGERTVDGITWEQECDIPGRECHLFPNPNIKIGSSDGTRPNPTATHPLITDTPNDLYNDKRRTYCSQLSNSTGILERHNSFWKGNASSPAAQMAGGCSDTEMSNGGCSTGYTKIKSIMKDEISKAMITNSALVGMYQGLDCGELQDVPALCQVHPDGTTANCAVPKDLSVKPSKYKEGCGKQCQQEIEALLAKLRISSQNVYFYLNLVMKYEGAYSKVNNVDNAFGKALRKPDGSLPDISTVVSDGPDTIVKNYFKTLLTEAESTSPGDTNYDAPITDATGLLFKDPRTAKYLRLAGKNYLEISLIEKKIMAIYMYTHKSLKDRINSIKSEVKKIAQSNQEELDRLRENAHTKVRGISKRQLSLEGNRSGVVSIRIAIIIMVILLGVFSTVPAASRQLRRVVDMVRRK